MSRSSFAEIRLGTEEAPEAVETEPDRPFRILLMGDFSGRSWRTDPPGHFTPRRIDRDNFDQVLDGMKVLVDVHGMALPFRELEDFHPDRIYKSATVFRNLDDLLDRLAPPPRPAARSAPASGLLDQIVSEQEPEPVSVEDADNLAAFVRRITARHVVREDPDLQRREARRQEIAGELMRGILLDPRMQAIEAAWRALFLLVHNLDTDGPLNLYALDITLPELVREMDAVREELIDKGPWGAIAANYGFGQSETEAHALRLLAGLADSLRAPLVAEALLSTSGAPNNAWRELRRTSEARWIGLALPRFLLRLPYGKETSPIESFPFEEMAGSEHGAYLWGNPAFAIAYLIGQSFLAHGWELGRHLEHRLDGLPIHLYKEDGGAAAKPCAEILMSRREIDSLLESGLMPLVSVKDEPAAILVRFQSIADPLAPLEGLG